MSGLSGRNKKIVLLLTAYLIFAIIVGGIRYAKTPAKDNTDVPQTEAPQTDTDDETEGQSGSQGQTGSEGQTESAMETESTGVPSGETEGDGSRVLSQEEKNRIITFISTPHEGLMGMMLAGVKVTPDTIISQADYLAKMYDYDKAIAALKDSTLYSGNKSAFDKKIKEYEKAKESLVKISDPTQITHIFFQTLIYDTNNAFDGDKRQDTYNIYHVTCSEFKKMLQQLYDKGYVLISLHDVIKKTSDANGNVSFSTGEIYLPEGKTPLILSQDEVNYYEYMKGDGFASRLVLDNNGNVKCEYVQDDGSVTVGDYDLIPILDAFVREHPDFSYHGAKGMLALTGSEGVFGYRTDIYNYGDTAGIQDEIKQAKKIADALKANGWEFACKSWGNIHVGSDSYDNVVTDTEKWISSVASIVGDSDVYVYSQGQDLGDWRVYDSSNQKYTYLVGKGFHYFCNTDASTRAWMQIGNDYARDARRDINGYRLYYDMTDPDTNRLSDLFDVDAVFDKARPVPVPSL